MGDSRIALYGAGHGIQIVIFIFGHAARTEQQSVTGRWYLTNTCRRWQCATSRANTVQSATRRSSCWRRGYRRSTGVLVEKAAHLVGYEAHSLYDVCGGPSASASLKSVGSSHGTHRFRRGAVLRWHARLRARQRHRIETQAARHRVDRDDVCDDADGLDILLFAEIGGDDTAIPPLAEATRIVTHAMNDLDHRWLGRRCSAWPRASWTPRWSRSPRRPSHSGPEVPIRRCIEIVRFRRDTGAGRRATSAQFYACFDFGGFAAAVKERSSVGLGDDQVGVQLER
jgi:hypothetical protein